MDVFAVAMAVVCVTAVIVVGDQIQDKYITPRYGELAKWIFIILWYGVFGLIIGQSMVIVGGSGTDYVFAICIWIAFVLFSCALEFVYDQFSDVDSIYQLLLIRPFELLVVLVILVGLLYMAYVFLYMV